MEQNGPILISPKGSNNLYSTITIAGEVVARSEVYALVDLNDFAMEYKATCTGLPNLKLELEQCSSNSDSNDDWSIPDNMADLNSSLIDKNQHSLRLPPIPLRYVRIKATGLTGNPSDTTVRIQISVQKKFNA